MAADLVVTCAKLGVQMARKQAKRGVSDDRVITCVEYWLDRCYLWSPQHREEALRLAKEMVR